MSDAPRPSDAWVPRPHQGVGPPDRTTARARAAAAAAGTRARALSRAAAARGIDAARTATTRASATAARARDATRETLAQLPPEARDELHASAARLARVRTPNQAVDAFEAEVEHLLRVVAPILVEHPLPVRRTTSARVLVASAAALAAAGEGLHEIGAATSGGTLLASLPAVVVANLLALVVEVYVTTSLRVSDLRGVGLPVEPAEVAADVVQAMTGSSGRAAHHVVTKTMVKSVAMRFVRRWGAGLVPVAGAAYSGWDAQRTVEAIRRMPLPVPGTLDVESRPTAAPARVLPSIDPLGA